MKVILDSTVLFHWQYHYNKTIKMLQENNATEFFITRVNYLEILSGASENAKIQTKKFLSQFPVLEFTEECKNKANTLAMKHRVEQNNQKDFLIAAIAITNNYTLITNNKKHFNFTGLKTVFYDTTFWF